MTFDEIIERFEIERRTKTGVMVKCKSHDDREASLAVDRAEGKTLVFCHARCPTEDVLAAVGLTKKDLFADSATSNRRGPHFGGAAPKGRVVDVYPYRDADGVLLYETVRYEPKTFRQRRPDGNGGYIWSLDGVDRVLYRLPELVKTKPETTIYAAEGERDVNNLVKHGLVATCNVGGAGKWRAAYSEHLRGRTVVIVPDNDVAGRKHAEQVARSLHGIAAIVKVIALPNLPPKGDVSDWLAGGGTAEELQALVDRAPAWTPSGDQTDGTKMCEAGRADPDVDHRVEIIIGPDEHRVNDEAFAALGSEPAIYARAHRLVRIVRPVRTGTAMIQVLPQSSLRELLTRRVRFLRRDVKGDLVGAHPPDWCVAALTARAELPGLRYLAGIAVAPTMRPDGSILDRPGYDDATALLLEPTSEVLPVPDQPTQEEARAAATALLDVVSDFPFALPAHRSAWLASVLTGFTRHAILGNVPGVVVDANARGSGKGLLVDTIAIITTGHPISRSPQPKDDEELRKHITAAAIADTPAILIDNVTGKFTYRSFDAAITCNGLWSDRILGRSERRVLPLNTVWFITSNNAALSSDTARRMLPIRLLSQVEHPEDRRDFQHADLLGWITAERLRLAQAALIVLRAYHVAGRPTVPSLEPWGSFEAWSALIRQCIVWLGLPDPLAARAELRERADVDRDAIRALLVTLHETLNGAEITAAELLERSTTVPELRAALDELCPPRPGEERPTVQRIGTLLRSLRDRIVDGRRLEARSGHGRALRWRVTRPNSDDGFDTNHTHHPHQGDGECGEDGEDPTGWGGNEEDAGESMNGLGAHRDSCDAEDCEGCAR